MLNVGELIHDPDFAQPKGFKVTRTTGTWTNGRFSGTTATIPCHGIIRPASSKDVVQTPQGDMISGEIAIYTDIVTPLYETALNHKTNNSGNLSDEVTWQGEVYKLIKVTPFVDFGYYKSIAVRKRGA